jgi:hypothetical protein
VRGGVVARWRPQLLLLLLRSAVPALALLLLM